MVYELYINKNVLLVFPSLELVFKRDDSFIKMRLTVLKTGLNSPFSIALGTVSDALNILLEGHFHTLRMNLILKRTESQHNQIKLMRCNYKMTLSCVLMK